MSKNASRAFSTAARYLKSLKWNDKSNTNVSRLKRNVEDKVDTVEELARRATAATVEGNPHETPKRDGTRDKLHISGVIFELSKKLTSYHAYVDGRVIFSKEKYNIPGSSGSQHGSTASGFRTGLTWTMDESGSCAMWWDGSEWKFGQWSAENQVWIALYNGEWYAWL